MTKGHSRIWGLSDEQKESGRAIATERTRNILFVRTDRLGETLLNLPTTVALKVTFPSASLTLLVREELEPLLTSLSWVDEVMADREASDAAWWQRAIVLARRLRSHHFDLAIVSNPKKELHAAVWLAGIPRRVGYDRKWGCLLTDRLPDRKRLGARHEVEYNLDLVRVLGIPGTIPPWQLPRFEHEQTDILRFLSEQGLNASESLVAVHPWTSNPRKQWPVERYRALIRLLVQQLPVRVVIVGGPEERSQVQAVREIGVQTVDLVGQLTLRQLAALFQRARLLVSNDSGPVHLSAAVGTSTVVLFGTTDAATGPCRWGPWGPGHRVIWKPTMEAITVEEVFTAIREQLDAHR